MKNETVDVEEVENKFKPIDDIICYECMQTRFSACIWLGGGCPLNML
jgi:hypothetical protein